MIKKLLLMFFIMFLLVGTVSAFLDIKSFNENEGEYGQIEIKDWLFLKKADYKLTNYDSSVIDVWAEGEYRLYKKTHLFTGVFYKDITGKRGDLRDVEFFIWEEKFETKYDPIYEDQNCHLDLNQTNVCDQVMISNESYQEDVSGWINYEKNMELEESEGKWRMEAKRKANKLIDFILEAHGKTFDEWAWWHGNWIKKQQMNLSGSVGNLVFINITHQTGMQSDFDDVRFIDSTETTEYDYALRDKSDGNWATYTLNNSGDDEFWIYFDNAGASSTSSWSDVYSAPLGINYLDDASGTSATGSLNGTPVGTPTVVTGFMGNALDFDPTVDQMTFAYDPVVSYSSFTGQIMFKTAVCGAPWHNKLSGANGAIVTASMTGCDNAWHTVFFTRSGTKLDLWVDGVDQGTDTGSMSGLALYLNYPVANKINWFSQTSSAGSGIILALSSWDGIIDEYIFWGKVLSDSEIIFYSSQTTPTTTFGSPISSNILVITQNSPVDYYNSSSQNVSFDCDGEDETGLYSLNLTINGSVYETVTGAGSTNLSLSSTETLIDGVWEWFCTGNDDQETKNTSTRYLTVDTTPFIEFIAPTPVNNSNWSETYIPISVNVSTSIFKNITYHLQNENGTFYEQFYTNETYEINFLDIPTAHYHYNVTICTTTNECNSTETRHMNHDVTVPVINVISPTGIYELLYFGQSLDLNYSINDTNIDKCWYIYNATTTLINCSLNTAVFNYSFGYNNLTVYANDTLGNENNFTKSWGYLISVESETFDSTTISTSLEDFRIDFDLNNTISSVASTLNYNGTSNLATTYSDYAEITINIPVVGNDENVTFNWTFGYSNVTGSYTVSTLLNTQLITNLSFYECSGAPTGLALNFTIYNVENYTLLNTSFESNFEFQIAGAGSVFSTYEYEDVNENTSNFQFCLDSDNENVTIDGFISYYASGYDRREYIIEDGTIGNFTQNIDLFLALTDLTDIVTLLVYDNYWDPLAGATVYVQRYDVGTNNYFTVGMVPIGNDGQGIINLRLYDIWYRFLVYYEGELVEVTDDEKLSSTEKRIEVTLTVPNPYELFETISYGVEFNNITNVASFTFADSSGYTNQGCLEIRKVSAGANSLYYYSCVNSTAGIISTVISENGTFELKGVITLTATYDGISQLVDSLIITIGESELATLLAPFGKVISFIIIGTMGAIGVAANSIILGLFLILVSLFGIMKMGWMHITITIFWTVLSVAILICAITIRRSK